MKTQFRVGELSKLFKIAPSTLRYYDEIGLLTPKFTSPDNHYRYYTIEQFVVLDTIIFLKKNGFSLKDIQQQINQRTPENSQELLMNKHKEVKLEINRLERIADKIENKISTIQEGLHLRNNLTVEYRYFLKRPISYIYHDKPIDLASESEEIYLKDLELLSNTSLTYDGFFAGDIGTIVDMRSMDEKGPIKYIAVFELIQEDQRKNTGDMLEEGWYACFPHKGPYEQIRESYQFLLKKIKEDGYEIVRSPVEVAVLDESVIQNSEDYVTLIQIPIDKFELNN